MSSRWSLRYDLFYELVHRVHGIFAGFLDEAIRKLDSELRNFFHNFLGRGLDNCTDVSDTTAKGLDNGTGNIWVVVVATHLTWAS